jgi:RNA polymerase sigma factor (TIGR02999 family)
LVLSEVTRILQQIESGDPSAADDLLPLIYEELRKLAEVRLFHEQPGQTLSATALVHEAYLRLVGSEREAHWDGKGHFFSAAAEAMRRILLNRARDKKRLKRGGDLQRRVVDLNLVAAAIDTPDEALIQLDEAIDRLANVDATSAQLVKLRFFAGLTLQDAASSLGLTRRQGDRLWAFSRAWLYDWLRHS